MAGDSVKELMLVGFCSSLCVVCKCGTPGMAGDSVKELMFMGLL